MTLAGRLPPFTWDRIAPLAEKARLHPDGAVDLSMGTPVDPVPLLIRQALAAASDAPGYPATWGTSRLRAAAAGWLERSLSVQLMHGAAAPRIKVLAAGEALVRQGEAGADIYLLLDGVIRVERDGERLAECGPGAMLGERAYLEGGIRTATLAAVTACRVAAVDARQLDRPALEELSAGHRREDAQLGLG